MILPVEGEIVMVAGEIIRLSFSSKMTALEETMTLGCKGESWGGVIAGVRIGYVVVILKMVGIRYWKLNFEKDLDNELKIV